MFKKIKKMIGYFLFKDEKINDIIIAKNLGFSTFYKIENLQNQSLEKTFPRKENPIKPYFKEFSNKKGYVDTLEERAYREDQLVRKFIDEGRPLSKQEYIDLFKEKVSVKNFLNEKKVDCLYKIWKDAQHIKNILEPLDQLGIKYTLDLTGGSVRDFVLDNHLKIKDLDFMLSIQEVSYFSVMSKKKEINVFPEVTSEELAKELSMMDSELLKSKLIQLCFNSAKEKITVFEHRTKIEGPDTNPNYNKDMLSNDRLISVIKMSDAKTNYPIDILLTDYTKPAFIADFDFDICKASFCFVNPYVKKEFPKNHTHLISRFVAETDFWADVKNKTFTYNITNKTQSQINSSIDKHLPSIEEKYPNHKVLITGYGDEKNYLKAKLTARKMALDLDSKLPHQPASIKIRRAKI